MVNSRPEFSCIFSSRIFSRPGFQHQFLIAFSRPARKDATDQNLLRQNFIAYIFGSQEGKRPAPSPKNESPLLTSLGARAPARQSARAQKRKSASKRENGGNPVPFKENYPPPRTCHSLIGCSPSAELSSRGRQSTWGGELPLAHAQIICLPLRTQDVSAIL